MLICFKLNDNDMLALAKQTMPLKLAIPVLDFAENYTCLMQNEAQVTIGPVDKWQFTLLLHM